jgi:RimJ/RimL family protein N-acetyltransferase
VILKIRTSRLLIRNLKDKDLEDFFLYRSDPEIVKYQGFDVFTRNDAREFINLQKEKTIGEPGEWIQFGIELVDSKRLIGDCAIFLDKDPGSASVGITISPSYQQQGYAKEVLAACIDYLFRERAIHRIVETVDADNHASIRLLKSLSFREEGYFIEKIFFKGRWTSEYSFAMIKKEWDKLH